MAFDKTGLKVMGGGGDGAEEGKILHYRTTDTMATVLGASYFDSITDSLDADYSMLISASDDIKAVKIDRSGTVLTYDTRVQTIAVAGAIDLVSRTSEVESAGAAQAMTLADGYITQRKTIIHSVDGGSLVLTPTTGYGYTTITFTTAGETVELVFGSLGWAVAGRGGLSAALPAVA